MVTHNLPGWLPKSDRQNALNKLAGAADIIALQEAPWLVDLPVGWAVVRGTDKALPILYRPAQWEPAGMVERRAYPDTTVGDWGAGPATLRAGWNHGVRLTSKADGRPLWVVNAHLAPSVEQARPVDPDDAASWEARRRLYRAEIAQLVDITSWINREPLFVCGDFNGTPTFPLLAPLVDRFDHATRPSHGGRAIDYIWYQRAKVGRVWEIPTASDHDAVAATFTV